MNQAGQLPGSPGTPRSLIQVSPNGTTRDYLAPFLCREFAPLLVDLPSQLPSLHIEVRQEMQSAKAQLNKQIRPSN